MGQPPGKTESAAYGDTPTSAPAMGAARQVVTTTFVQTRCLRTSRLFNVSFEVLAEALTNIAKHAEATQADVEVVQARGRLRLRIVDDGVGGADPARGSGLAGLARRAASVDGTFALTSPVGGPTVITVELPCAL